MKFYVIAGTYQEAMAWIKQDLAKKYSADTSMSISNYHYVSHSHDLKGVQNPHGSFVGNWMGRPDIIEIVEEMVLRSNQNPALVKVYKDLTGKPSLKRPTPKVKP